MSAKGKNKVVVVTVSEMFPYHGSDVKVVVFSNYDKAEQWVESDIASRMAMAGNDCEVKRDGWFLELESPDHAIQYNAQEMDVL